MRKLLVFLATACLSCSFLDLPSETSGGKGGSRGAKGGAAGTGGSSGSAGGGGAAGKAGAAGSSGTGAAGAGAGAGGAGGSAAGAAGSAGAGGAGRADAGMGGGAGTGTGGAGASGAAGVPDAGTGRGGASGAGGGSSDGSTGTPDAGGDGQQACAALADAYCNRLQACSPFVTSVAYGDVATCRQRWILNCLPNFAAPGTSATPARTNACAQSLPAITCATFLSGDIGPACAVAPGTIAQGGACGDDAQCASTFCARAPDAVCGTCQPATQPGDPCVQGSCSASTNTVCPAGTTTCVRPVAGQVGDMCVGHEQCDIGNRVGCNPTNSRCIALTLAQSGGTCGANSIIPSSVAVCPAAGTCSASLAGRCQPVGADGASCSTADTGTHCMLPARCVSGRCTLPDPITCR